MTKQLITTSIAYINAEPHIGFLFELVAADVLARYHHSQKDDVFLLTGTDEHGTKVAQAAEVSGLPPQVYADQLAAKFREVCDDFDVDYRHFVRTTDPKHTAFVQAAWQTLVAAGVIEKRRYDGWYCTGCEAFKTERELADGRCLIHRTPVEKISEENYFLLITPATKQTIHAWISTGVAPAGRQAEAAHMLAEIDAVSISRPADKLSWGIPVPGDGEQTLYVWLDALLNYLSGVEAAGQKIAEWWPSTDQPTSNLQAAQTQLIGKDILKFHAVIWPTILLSLGYPLPTKLLVHGFITVDGQKMSKSVGNIIAPAELKKRYGVDATRYLLLRQLNFYDDSNFSWAEFDALYNGELANGIGNLLARIVSLLRSIKEKTEESVRAQINLAAKDVSLGDYVSSLEAADFRDDLNQVNIFVKSADEWITRQKPWEWSKQDKIEQRKIAELIDQSKLFEIAYLLEPFMPTAAQKIRQQLTTLEPEPLFPRLDN